MDAYIYQGDNYHHCVDCGSTINFGDMVFRGKWGYRCYTCQYYYDKRESGLMTGPICGDCEHYNGRNLCRKMRYTEGELDLAICIDFERKIMPNIKITAEVNGKQVPLETISTESFEAIKAAARTEEIPVARLAVNDGQHRLIFKVTEYITEYKGKYVAISLDNGLVCGHWPESDMDCGKGFGYNYENVRPL